jgi:co-chaperonin GroES (HSP10)
MSEEAPTYGAKTRVSANGRSRLPQSSPEAIGDRIVVLQDEAAEQIGNILLSAGAQETPIRGLVCSVGRGRVLEAAPAVLQIGTEAAELVQARNAIEVKVGERIWFAPYAASVKIEWDGLAFVVLREEDILAREPTRA